MREELSFEFIEEPFGTRNPQRRSIGNDSGREARGGEHRGHVFELRKPSGDRDGVIILAVHGKCWKIAILVVRHKPHWFLITHFFTNAYRSNADN